MLAISRDYFGQLPQFQARARRHSVANWRIGPRRRICSSERFIVCSSSVREPCRGVRRE